jgi:hypothetical protein
MHTTTSTLATGARKNGSRQASYYDPKTQKFQLIETCYSTHHLQFDNDADATVYFNELSGPTFGWIDSKVYDKVLADTKMNPRPSKLQWVGAIRFSTPTAMERSRKPLNGTAYGFRYLLYATDTAAVAGAPAAAAPAAPAASRSTAEAQPSGRSVLQDGRAGGAAGQGGGWRGGAAAAHNNAPCCVQRDPRYSSAGRLQPLFGHSQPGR